MAVASAEMKHLSRFQRLATPKSLPTGFLEDRRSVYWENHIPMKDYSTTTVFALSPRQGQLVYSKHLHRDYVGDRPSPAWPVSPSALKATPTPRLLHLATPKILHPDYHPCRQVMTLVPQAALRVSATERLSHLARHKTYPPLRIRANTEWDWGEWQSSVTQAAKAAEASSRVIQLAEGKRDHLLYRPCREVQWPVTNAARCHTASDLTVKLAQHKTRTSEDYDPKAWTVSRAALHTQPSPRLTELATPLPRKCRQRKQ